MLQSGGELENDEVLAENLMRLMLTALKLHKCSYKSDGGFRRLSGDCPRGSRIAPAKNRMYSQD